MGLGVDLFLSLNVQLAHRQGWVTLSETPKTTTEVLPLLDTETLSGLQVALGFKGNICGVQDLANIPQRNGQEYHVQVKLKVSPVRGGVAVSQAPSQGRLSMGF